MKNCTKCKKAKELTDFYQDGRTKDGRYAACKTCHNINRLNRPKLLDYVKREPTPKNVSSYLFSRMAWRVTFDEKYKDIKLCLTKDEFTNFVAINWPIYESLFKAWKANDWDRSLSPSVDRIDPTKHYSLDNIQIIAFGENARRGQVRRWANHKNFKTP